MMYMLYTVFSLLFFPIILLGLLVCYRSRFIRHCTRGIDERMGRLVLPENISSLPIIWLHASSIGELNMLKPLIAELRSHYLTCRICISTVTPEARELARKEKLSDYSFFAPLDIPCIVRRSIRKIKPVMLLLAESELWPCLIIEARRSGAVVGVVNARVSDAAFRIMKRFSWWYRWLFGNIHFIGAREKEDQQRLVELGFEKDRIELTGNIKYDAIQIKQLFEGDIEKIQASFFMMPENKVFVCGSIHPDETGPILEACIKVKKEFPGFSVILVPRHLEAIPKIKKIIERYQVTYRLKSAHVGQLQHVAECLIVDTVGELLSAYRIATVVFVGGSLVPHGGQNIIEPALLEKPVIFGPHMFNFKTSAQEFLRCGGARQISSSDELAGELTLMLSDHTYRANLARRGLSVASGLKGGAVNTIRLIYKYMK